MVTIRTKKIGKQNYYYLEHSLKLKNKVVKKEIYLGKKLPKNIEAIKGKFMHQIFKEKWYKTLEKIKKAFSKEFSKMPKIAKEKYIQTFMIKFTYNTDKIEGSTLSLKETADLLEEGITPRNKPLKDVKEAEAHKKVFYEMLNYKKDLNLKTILYWHKLLFQESEPEIAGKIRKHPVAIARTKVELPLPAELNFLLRDFLKWYNKNKKKFNPVEFASLVHLKFVTIHPFSDGNGRISRLMMNFILHKNNYPMLNITYNFRSSYYTALERAQTKDLNHIFVQYLIKRYIKLYQRYLKT